MVEGKYNKESHLSNAGNAYSASTLLGLRLDILGAFVGFISAAEAVEEEVRDEEVALVTPELLLLLLMDLLVVLLLPFAATPTLFLFFGGTLISLSALEMDSLSSRLRGDKSED